MPDLSPVQLIIALVIALVVLGPKRLPEVGRSLGRGIREFKDSVSGNDRDEDEDVKRRAGIEPPAPVAYQPPQATPAERAPQRD
jgi:sec-independent protein translocase protein TatA